MKKVNRIQAVAMIVVVALSTLAHAQTYTDLFDFTQATGSGPGTPDLLAQGQDGNIYGTMPSVRLMSSIISPAAKATVLPRG